MRLSLYDRLSGENSSGAADGTAGADQNRRLAIELEHTRSEANRQRVLLDSRIDPREVEREEDTAKAALQAEEAGRAVTVADVWPRYMAEGKPKRRAAWKPRYLLDLNRAASLGGERDSGE